MDGGFVGHASSGCSFNFGQLVGSNIHVGRWPGYDLEDQQLCAFDQRVTGVPLPCVSVDLKRGFAVMNAGPKHLLLVPTARVQGVESRQLLDVNAPNYFEYAWNPAATSTRN